VDADGHQRPEEDEYGRDEGDEVAAAGPGHDDISRVATPSRPAVSAPSSYLCVISKLPIREPTTAAPGLHDERRP
jgi:hypothetical protein